jgi:hypothetical protein
MKRFEYRVEHSLSESDLNRLGEKGWDLVAIYKIHPENMYVKFVFKREL